MAVPNESALVSTLMDRVEALEKKYAALESTYDELSSSKGAFVVPLAPPVAPSKLNTLTPIDDGKTEEILDDKPTSRVKIIISTRKEDGEPVETLGKQPPPKKEVFSECAFVLKKITYPKNTRDFEPCSQIDIVNPKLWALLKEHLGWYPYHIFRESPVTLQSPFEPIIFDWDKLQRVSNSREAVKDQEDLQARMDLGLLLDTISGGSSGDENLDKYFRARDSPSDKDQKMIQFTDLWTIFPPGTFIYGRPFQNEDQVFIVKDYERSWPTPDEDNGVEYLPWRLEAWSYDWKDGTFGRTSFKVSFDSFDGHVPLDSLPYFPFEHHRKRSKIRETLIERGKKFQEFCKATKASRLFEYAGDAIPEKKGFSGMQLDDHQFDLDDIVSRSEYLRRASNYRFRGRALPPSGTKSSKVTSRVMVDYASYFQYGPVAGRNGALTPSDDRPDCGCSDCRQKNIELMHRYRRKFDKNAKAKVWDDDQYLICPPRVLGYVLREKQWAQLQVSLLHPIPVDDETDAWNSRLQLADPKTKKVLYDLVCSHTSPASTENGHDKMLEVDDIVPGKGKGLVILLYGPPGVGKTSTAETIAVAARRPLFSVSVADVGTKAANVEANLSKIFSLATSWEAILLIDEADVFLESRGRGGVVQSMEKNALVSVFLRVLEYYQGIMFLTTNQIAEFDVAIPSRIHIAIQYESLKEEQMRKIFEGFLRKLDDNNLIEDYGGILEWLSDDVYGEKLDGRQIRNVVTTGLNLARAADGKSGKGRGRLTKHHLKDAFNNVKQFKRDFATQMQRYIDSQQKMIR